MSFMSPTFILRPFAKAFMPKFQTVNKTYFIGESTSTEFQKSHPFNVETENPLQSSTKTAGRVFSLLGILGLISLMNIRSHEKILSPHEKPLNNNSNNARFRWWSLRKGVLACSRSSMENVHRDRYLFFAGTRVQRIYHVHRDGFLFCIGDVIPLSHVVLRARVHMQVFLLEDLWIFRSQQL